MFHLQESRGLCLSEFILQAFSRHFIATSGAIEVPEFGSADALQPKPALSLAVVAVISPL
jgi:hypothetical protein